MNRRFPSLNGWRAISILLVLGNHTPVIPGFPPEHRYFFTTWIDGNLGVRFFFSISGFLITWLMLAEEAEYKRVSLKNFYIRRSLRIWPVYFAYVAVSLVLQVTGRCSQSADAWRGVLTFTRNFHDETAGAPGDFVTAHLWSLSIEEQFYLFWPFIFCFIGARQRIGVLLAAILFSIGFRTVELFGLYDRHHAHYLFQTYSTFNYLDCLAWGCLGAFALAAARAKLTAFAEKHSAAIFPVCFSMVFIPWLVRLGAGIQTVGFVGLLLHSVLCPEWMFYRVLNYKWMDRIGVWSYSIYIWQEFVWWLWPPFLEKVWFLWIPATCGLAWLSYEFLEKPFFALRSKFHDPGMKFSRLFKFARPSL
jgi:peptidoglycan/LPS O-acetylase OafA/YrhL